MRQRSPSFVTAPENHFIDDIYQAMAIDDKSEENDSNQHEIKLFRAVSQYCSDNKIFGSDQSLEIGEINLCIATTVFELISPLINRLPEDDRPDEKLSDHLIRYIKYEASTKSQFIEQDDYIFKICKIIMTAFGFMQQKNAPPRSLDHTPADDTTNQYKTEKNVVKIKWEDIYRDFHGRNRDKIQNAGFLDCRVGIALLLLKKREVQNTIKILSQEIDNSMLKFNVEILRKIDDLYYKLDRVDEEIKEKIIQKYTSACQFEFLSKEDFGTLDEYAHRLSTTKKKGKIIDPQNIVLLNKKLSDKQAEHRESMRRHLNNNEFIDFEPILSETVIIKDLIVSSKAKKQSATFRDDQLMRDCDRLAQLLDFYKSPCVAITLYADRLNVGLNSDTHFTHDDFIIKRWAIIVTFLKMAIKAKDQNELDILIDKSFTALVSGEYGGLFNISLPEDEKQKYFKRHLSKLAYDIRHPHANLFSWNLTQLITQNRFPVSQLHICERPKTEAQFPEHAEITLRKQTSAEITNELSYKDIKILKELDFTNKKQLLSSLNMLVHAKSDDKASDFEKHLNLIQEILSSKGLTKVENTLMKLLMPIGISKLCCNNCNNDLQGTNLPDNLAKIFENIFTFDMNDADVSFLRGEVKKFIDCPVRGAHGVYYPTNSKFNRWTNELNTYQQLRTQMGPLNTQMSVTIRTIDFDRGILARFARLFDSLTDTEDDNTAEAKNGSGVGRQNSNN